MQRIVLAYSGDLDSSVAIPWLAEKHRAEIVTITMDLGQGQDLGDVRDRALAIGAVRAHVLDLREEFARDFLLPALQAGAVHDGRDPLGTALGRPLIAKHLAVVARIEGAMAVAHCAAPGPDQARLETSLRAVDPELKVIAPANAWGLTPSEKVEYARSRGIPVPTGVDGAYTADRNLWGRSVEGEAFADAWREPPEEIYVLTKSAAEAPDAPAFVEIEFARGVPLKINDVEMPLVDLIQSLETIAGAHGVGRIDQASIGSRGIHEAPAAVALHTAHKALQQFVTLRDLERLMSDLAVAFADLVHNGLWYAPTREAIGASVAKVQEKVTGVIRFKCFKGDCRVVGRTTSPGTRMPNEPMANAMATNQ